MSRMVLRRMKPPFTPFSDENVTLTSQAPPVGAVGCTVALVGGGGASANGVSGTRSTGGGGGGSAIAPVFIPVSKMGSTYSTAPGPGGATTGAAGTASTFSSGSLSLSAGGGNGASTSGTTGGTGGTATGSGLATPTRAGSAGGAGNTNGSAGAAGTNNSTGGAAGGGAGATSIGSAAGGKGGNSATVTGAAAGTAGNNPGSTPTASASGLPGGGASGGGATSSAGASGGVGGAYGGGAGGAGAGSGGSGVFKAGGVGTNKIDWTDVYPGPPTLPATPTTSATTTVTIPAHLPGDLIIIFASRASTTVPSKPGASGNVPTWNDIDAGGGSNGYSTRTAYAYATTSAHTSGTWTSATAMCAVVIRGASAFSDLVLGGHAVSNNASANNSVGPSITPTNIDGTSLILDYHTMAGTAFSTGSGLTPPTGYTRRVSAATVCLNTSNDSTSVGATTQASNATAANSGAQIEIRTY